MNQPFLFPLFNAIKGKPAEEIRELAHRYRFARVQPLRKYGSSELWVCGMIHGYGCLRLDLKGHRSPFDWCRAPHAHKEWIPSDAFPDYLENDRENAQKMQRLDRLTIRYNDLGVEIAASRDYKSGNLTEKGGEEAHIPIAV